VSASGPMMFGHSESTASLITFSVGLQCSREEAAATDRRSYWKANRAWRLGDAVLRHQKAPWAGRQTASSAGHPSRQTRDSTVKCCGDQNLLSSVTEYGNKPEVV